MQILQISSFKEVLQAYSVVDPEHSFFIDGGAGYGTTCIDMLAAAEETCKGIYAFEPNPINRDVFKASDSRIILLGKALSSENGYASFSISKSISDESSQLHGYSSVGKIVTSDENISASGQFLTVECCRAEDYVESNPISFIKLDLQGGELDALHGLQSILPSVKWMWIEFSNQPGLYEFLAKNDFMLFDCEYLFAGTPNEFHYEKFHISRQGKNTLGKSIFHGFRKESWTDGYIKTLDFNQRRRRLVQTDLVAINKRHFQIFFDALKVLLESKDIYSIGNLEISLR